MQLLLLCVVALTVALCAGYLPGNEYTYQIRGQILHELAKQRHQHAGYLFKSTLIAQVHKDSTIVQITDSHSTIVNERAEFKKPIDLEKVNYRTPPAEVTEHLSKPFEVVYHHGLVTEIKVAKDDPLWSVNIKKAVASKMQMNFDRVNLIEDKSHKNHSHFDNNYYYKVFEDGIHGECGIEYVIDDSEHNEISVTKTTDFMSCKEHAYRWYSNENNDFCHECGKHIYGPQHMSEISHSLLKGERNNFVKEKMVAEQRYIYAPHGMADAEYIKGDAKMEMLLEDVKPIANELHLPDDKVTHNDLHFHFQEPEEIKTADDLKKTPHYIFHFAEMEDSKTDDAIKMFELISAIKDDEHYTEIYKDKNMPVLFLQLSSAMSSLSYDQLDEIFKSHVITEPENTEEGRHKRLLFINGLMSAGTSSSFMFLKHIITDRTPPRHIVMYIVGHLPENIKHISPALIEEYYTLCEHPKVKDNLFTHKVCYLAFSRFVHEQCVAKYHKITKVWHKTEKPRCTPETAEHYFELMVKKHEGHSKDSLERILCIKTAANFGTRSSLDYLRKVFHDHHLPTYFRFSAIWSLEHQANLYPEEVLPLMMPVYFNTSEPHEIRIAALIYILSSEPELHHLEAIAQTVYLDPDHQVAHYTMTVLKRLSEAESPCYEKLRGMSNRVLRHLKRVDFKIAHDFRHSFFWFSNGFDKKFKLGGSTYASFITSNDSYVPTEFSFGMEDYSGISTETPFEIGYVGYGLDKVFDRIIGLMKQRKSLLNLFRRKARDVDIVEKELKEIDEKLHIDTRVPEPLYADFYITAFGSELNFFHFNDQTFQNIFKHGANYLGEILNVLKDVSKYTTKNFFTGKQLKFITPSMLGFPMYLDITEAHFFYYRNNNFKFNVSPNPLAEGTDENTPTTINLKIDGHLVHDKTLVLGVGAILPKIHVITGAGIMKNLYNSVPLKVKMAVEPSTPKVVVKYTPIKPHTIIKRSFLPFTMVFDLKEKSKDVKTALLPYVLPNEMETIEKDVLHDWLGYGVHYKAHVGKLNKFSSWGDFWKFVVENDLREQIYYLSENPLAVSFAHEISVTPASNEPTDEVDTVFNFDHFGYETNSDKVYKPDFPTVQDGFENYINSRGDRKASSCVMKMERVFKGTKERSVAAEFAYTYTFDKLYHKFELSYDRSPFHSSETEHFKVCKSSSIMFPHVDMKKLYELDTVDMDPSIKVATDLHFGKNCENDKKITIRGDMSRTEEHKQMQAHREDPKHQSSPWINADAYLYKKCKEDIAEGFHYSKHCRKYWYRSLKLRHYSLDIELENLGLKDRYILRKLDSCLKTDLRYYVTDHPNLVANDSNKIHIEADFSAKSDHVDITIRKPEETTEFTHVPHPEWIQARSATPFFEFTNKMKRWSYFRKPYCAVESDNVHTFDDVLYKLPPIDCYKVLAKDCSHKELFTVLGKKIKHVRYEKAVKVFLKKWKIEAFPVSEDSEIIIRLNGQAIPVTEAEPYFHYEQFKGKDVLMFSVSFNGLQYKIKSEQLGVTVYYGGTAIVVTLNPYYRGKQCGICGDFNNNDLDEFVGPRNCVYENATDFGYSYAIPEDGCQVPAITAPCEHHHS